MLCLLSHRSLHSLLQKAWAAGIPAIRVLQAFLELIGQNMHLAWLANQVNTELNPA